jgi:hypothetical protein
MLDPARAGSGGKELWRVSGMQKSPPPQQRRRGSRRGRRLERSWARYMEWRQSAKSPRNNEERREGTRAADQYFRRSPYFVRASLQVRESSRKRSQRRSRGFKSHHLHSFPQVTASRAATDGVRVNLRATNAAERGRAVVTRLAYASCVVVNAASLPGRSVPQRMRVNARRPENRHCIKPQSGSGSMISHNHGQPSTQQSQLVLPRGAL